MKKKISPATIVALKEDLSCIYWAKKDLRSFMEYGVENKGIFSKIDLFGNTKYERVSKIMDYLE